MLCLLPLCINLLCSFMSNTFLKSKQIMSFNHFAQSMFLVISSLINIFRILPTTKVKLVYNFLAPPQAFFKEGYVCVTVILQQLPPFQKAMKNLSPGLYGFEFESFLEMLKMLLCFSCSSLPQCVTLHIWTRCQDFSMSGVISSSFYIESSSLHFSFIS